MAVDKGLLVVIKSSTIGDAEPDLGVKLMRNFLDQLYQSGSWPAQMIFMGTGIFLTTEGSPVLDILKNFEDQGTEIYSCLTCLDYYGRKEKLHAGKEGNMKNTVGSMLRFGRVISI